MKKDINQEIEDMANKVQKSLDPKEVLFETITLLGPAALRERLSTLSESDRVVLKSVLEEMVTLKKAKSVEFDKEATGAKHIQGNIMDTIIQEEIGNDDADEKLVKPEAAKHNHQGNSVEGWEGQVIKGDDGIVEEKHEIKAEEKQQEKIAAKVGKYKEGKSSMKKSSEQLIENEEAVVKAVAKMKEQGKKDEEISERLERKGKMSKEKVKGIMEKAMKMSEASKKIMDMEEKEHGTKDPKKLVEAEKKEHKMKKSDHDSGTILKEEDQLGDTDQMTAEPKKMEDETQDPAKANKQAQKDVNNMKVQKSVDWSPENSLLKSHTGGRNFTFNVGDFVEEMLKAEEKMKAKPGQEEESEEGEEKEEPKMKMKKSDINDLIEKSEDQSQFQEDMKKSLAAQAGAQSGKLVKSFNEVTDLAVLLGLSEEEAKKILG